MSVGSSMVWYMSSTTTSAPPVLALTTFMQRVSQRLGEHAHAPLSVAPSAELTELAVSMEALEAQFAAAKLAVIREIDRRDAAKDLGATGTTAWLRSGPARMRPGNAAQTVRLGKELDHTLHHTRDALAAGQLSVDHADVIAHAIRALPKEADPWVRAEAERVLIEHAQTFNPHELA